MTKKNEINNTYELLELYENILNTLMIKTDELSLEASKDLGEVLKAMEPLAIDAVYHVRDQYYIACDFEEYCYDSYTDDEIEELGLDREAFKELAQEFSENHDSNISHNMQIENTFKNYIRSI